jgi:hypothetical protein
LIARKQLFCGVSQILPSKKILLDAPADSAIAHLRGKVLVPNYGDGINLGERKRRNCGEGDGGWIG